jgi:outer membrane protein OmpA-like peptidoglycan-associated protein
MPQMNQENLSKKLLPPKENSELAASLFLYQLALKDKEMNGELFGNNLCIDYKTGSNPSDPSQHFKLVSRNGVFDSGSSKVDTQSKDFQRLNKVYSKMKKYFDAIDAGPKVTATGFTDGERIAGSNDSADSNKRLGRRRAQNIAKALGIDSVNAKSYITNNSKSKVGEASRCGNRRVTTVSFEATPKVHFGSKGKYTPSFEMIKDHERIKSYAMLSAIEMLSKHDGDIKKVIESMPKECNNYFTANVLKKSQESLGINLDPKDFGKRLNRAFPGSHKDIDSSSPVLKHLKYLLHDGYAFKRQLTMTSLRGYINSHKKIPSQKAEFYKILLKINENEISIGRRPTLKMKPSALAASSIPQSNHPYDCFDVKNYYKEDENKPSAQDVSSFVKNGKLEISFTKDDFESHGNHLHCGQCGSGMSIGGDGTVVRKVRTSKEFTGKAGQGFNEKEHVRASNTIKLASLNNFNSMASHKSMKVVVINNCDDPSEVDVFSADNTILTINSVPFSKTIDVPSGSKICVVNMPVINTCTIEPKGQIKTNQKNTKKLAHYYSLDGKEMTSTILKSNLSVLDTVNEIVNSEGFSCTGFKVPAVQSAQEVMDSISCKNKDIIPPADSNKADDKECGEGYTNVTSN